MNNTDNYVKVSTDDSTIRVWFYNEMEKPLAIGEKMHKLNQKAYMNGYNWDALFNYYLAKYAPEILEGLDSNPEGGSYLAIFELTAENKLKAERFADIITHLIENEDKLFKIVRDEGDMVIWD